MGFDPGASLGEMATSLCVHVPQVGRGLSVIVANHVTSMFYAASTSV